jgi:hypothetical protein
MGIGVVCKYEGVCAFYRVEGGRQAVWGRVGSSVVVELQSFGFGRRRDRVALIQGRDRRRWWLGFISMAQEERQWLGAVALGGMSRNGGGTASFLREEDDEYLG